MTEMATKDYLGPTSLISLGDAEHIVDVLTKAYALASKYELEMKIRWDPNDQEFPIYVKDNSGETDFENAYYLVGDMVEDFKELKRERDRARKEYIRGARK